MNLKSYTSIIFAKTFVPVIGLFITGCIVWCYYRKSERLMALMLMIMKNIISRKNIDKRPTYLVCNRKLPSSSRPHFMLNSLFIVAMCVQCFFTLAIVDVTYECTHDPDLDCFKREDDVKLSDIIYDESPVNCSTISRGDFVICYRMTIFDPEKVFIGAAAGYLLFKLIKFGLLIVAYTMLWAAQKWEQETLLCFRLGFCLIIAIVIVIPLILKIFLDDVESAFRKMSYTVLTQFTFLLAVIVHFVAWLPWEKFGKSEEYYGDASLPDNVAAHDNEMN